MAPRVMIGDAAKASGVPAKTIRYYEQVGLLPAATRASSGYRLYDEPSVERLRFIRRARALGLPLHELKTVIGALKGGQQPALRPQLRDLVRSQLQLVTNQIAELERLRRQLEQVLEHMRTSARPPRGHRCLCLETNNGHVRRGGAAATEASETSQ